VPTNPTIDILWEQDSTTHVPTNPTIDILWEQDSTTHVPTNPTNLRRPSPLPRPPLPAPVRRSPARPRAALKRRPRAQRREIQALADGLGFAGAATVTWAADEHDWFVGGALRTVPRGFSGRGTLRWPRWADLEARWEADLVRQSFALNARAPAVARSDGFSLAAAGGAGGGALLKLSVPASGAPATAWLQGAVSLCGVAASALIRLSDAGAALRTGGRVGGGSAGGGVDVTIDASSRDANPATAVWAVRGAVTPSGLRRLAELVPAAAVARCAGKGACSRAVRQAVSTGTGWYSLCDVTFELRLDPRGTAPDLARVRVGVSGWVLRNAGRGWGAELDLTDEAAAARALAALLVRELGRTPILSSNMNAGVCQGDHTVYRAISLPASAPTLPVYVLPSPAELDAAALRDNYDLALHASMRAVPVWGRRGRTAGRLAKEWEWGEWGRRQSTTTALRFKAATAAWELRRDAWLQDRDFVCPRPSVPPPRPARPTPRGAPRRHAAAGRDAARRSPRGAAR
jgi:hypothetical protein